MFLADGLFVPTSPATTLINPMLLYQQMLSATLLTEICRQQQLQNRNTFQKEKLMNFNLKNEIIDQQNENDKTFLPRSESLKFNIKNQNSLFSSLNISITQNNKEKKVTSISTTKSIKNEEVFATSLNSPTQSLNSKQIKNQNRDCANFNIKTECENINESKDNCEIKRDLLRHKKQTTLCRRAQSQIQLDSCKQLWRPFDPPIFNTENGKNEIVERELHIYSSSPSLTMSS